MRHVGNIGDIVYFFGQCCCWVTGSHWSRGSQGFFVGQFCFCDFFFWVTGSRWSRGSRDVFWEKFVSGSQGHVDTQNWVTYVTRKTIVHRDTGSRWSRGLFLWENVVSGWQGHVDTQNWVTYVTRKPIVHRDTGSRGVFFGKILFLGHRVTWIHKIGSRMWPRSLYYTETQGHAGHVGHMVFFWENFVSGSQGHVDHVVCFW